MAKCASEIPGPSLDARRVFHFRLGALFLSLQQPSPSLASNISSPLARGVARRANTRGAAMIDQDALSQFLANARSVSTTATSIVTPSGIVTITVEFEPFDDGEDED